MKARNDADVYLRVYMYLLLPLSLSLSFYLTNVLHERKSVHAAHLSAEQSNASSVSEVLSIEPLVL